MSMTDPIADFLARIRNGIRARKQLIECPRSNIKLRLAEILRDEGFVQGVTSVDDHKQGVLKLTLRYDGRTGSGHDGLWPLASRSGVPRASTSWFLSQPTDPSSEIEISFWASTANSMGSCCSTSLTKPFTIRAVASSSESPRCWQ